MHHRHLLGLAALATATAAPAQALLDTTRIDARVAAFAGAPIGQEGGAAAPVDRRLRLADCGDSLILGWRTERRDAVVVSCTGMASWRIFVPIRMAAASSAAAGFGAPAGPRVEPVIRRGDPVTIRSATSGFSVTSEGVAMGDAAPGARLRVTVAGSRTPIQAVAVEAGLVSLPGS